MSIWITGSVRHFFGQNEVKTGEALKGHIRVSMNFLHSTWKEEIITLRTDCATRYFIDRLYGWMVSMKTKVCHLYQRVPQLALTRCEVAEALGLSEDTISRLTKKGLLNAVRVVRRPIYAVTEVQRFLSENTKSDLLK